MRIMVNHLTRMSGSYICVAGLVNDGREHVRPLLATGRLDRNDLAAAGGLFRLGGMVDLGSVRRTGTRPEVEDIIYDPRNATAIRVLDRVAYWQRIEAVSELSLRAIFGEDLQPDGMTAVVPAGAGRCSLGCLAPASPLSLDINPWGKLRLDLRDPDLGELELPVTDLRCFPESSPDEDVVAALQDRMRAGERFILAVGLTRPWAPFARQPVHWLQVNNIFPEQEPLW